MSWSRPRGLAKAISRLSRGQQIMLCSLELVVLNLKFENELRGSDTGAFEIETIGLVATAAPGLPSVCCATSEYRVTSSARVVGLWNLHPLAWFNPPPTYQSSPLVCSSVCQSVSPSARLLGVCCSLSKQQRWRAGSVQPTERHDANRRGCCAKRAKQRDPTNNVGYPRAKPCCAVRARVNQSLAWRRTLLTKDRLTIPA